MYDFDEIIDRRHTNAMNTDGVRDYIFHADDTMTFPYKDEEFIRMWVADMQFAKPDVVIDGMRRRLDKRIFGYTRVFGSEYYNAFAAWCRRRYGWDFPQEQLVMSNAVSYTHLDVYKRQAVPWRRLSRRRCMSWARTTPSSTSPTSPRSPPTA